MPLYEYECKSCKAKFEELVFSHKPEVVCRQCGSTDVSRLLSVFSVTGGSTRAETELGPCASCGAAQRGSCMLQ